jgi:hypothetical protein
VLIPARLEPLDAGRAQVHHGLVQFRQAARRLEAEGFKPDTRRHRWWAKPHTADTWLEKPDVEKTLAGFIEQDARTIVDSRILKGELEAANQRGGRRVRRKRR